MNAKITCLSLSAMAFLSTSSAIAQSIEYNMVPTGNYTGYVAQPLQTGLIGNRLYQSGLLNEACSPCANSALQTVEYARIMPRLGNACGLSGSRLANPVFQFDIFKWGLDLGVVRPSLDMRPPGE